MKVVGAVLIVMGVVMIAVALHLMFTSPGAGPGHGTFASARNTGRVLVVGVAVIVVGILTMRAGKGGSKKGRKRKSK